MCEHGSGFDRYGVISMLRCELRKYCSPCWLFLYDLRTGGLLRLEEESIPATKRTRSNNSALSSIMFPVATFFISEGVMRTSLEAIKRNYDKHRGQTEGSGEAGGRDDEEWLDLDALLENDL